MYLSRASLFCSFRLHVFARPHRTRDTIPDISRRRSLPHRRNPGNNQPLGRKKVIAPWYTPIPHLRGCRLVMMFTLANLVRN